MDGNFSVLFAFVAVCIYIGVTDASPAYTEERPSYESIFKRGFTDMFKCKREGQKCWGAPKCCDNLQCYWENGYKPFTKGRCVTCVDTGLPCHRNAQCCGDNVCNVETWDVNGVCGPETK